MKVINVKNILWSLIRQLSNLNFSIFLLFVISFFIMIGSIIEQDQNIEYYKAYYPFINCNYTYISIFINWKIICYCGLDHVYQTWWFISILFLFALSLAACSLSVQLPSLKNARRWKFLNPKISRNLQSQSVNSIKRLDNSYSNMIYSLVSHDFYVFHKKNCIYAYKGLIGRISPIFVHLSIIFILLGSIFSSFLGYTVQEMIPSGEIFHTKNIVHSGFYSKLNSSFIFRIDEFFIDYNFDNSIKQFISKLSLFKNNGKFLFDKTIFVNSPLTFNGLTIYQTDWHISAVRFSIGYNRNIIIQKNLIKVNIDNKICWLCKIPLDDNKQIFILLFNLKDKIIISNENGTILSSVFINEFFSSNGLILSINDIMVDTGLQIKVDPGVLIIYLGFFILMLSTLVSYTSYCQVWITIFANILLCSGSTNRSIFFFEEDIVKVNKVYSLYTCN
uniref:Cytochrome c biogenesis protein Ccs1 n=1 Tax=Dasya naccarioides TaxID=2007180 RepID=A0A1Z1MGB6_9FLOR|nr:cytochrome c biogenesis protein ccs1 [Dasya naccarioides]ARW65108.1 cytochrome c biogenesis protein ccs1 [Dasya naccarioides]